MPEALTEEEVARRKQAMIDRQIDGAFIETLPPPPPSPFFLRLLRYAEDLIPLAYDKAPRFLTGLSGFCPCFGWYRGEKEDSKEGV